MNLLGNDPFSGSSSYLDHEDILIRKLLLTHDPDGRHLDSELLLRVTEHIMLYATTSEVPVTSLSVTLLCPFAKISGAHKINYHFLKIIVYV